MTPDGLTICPSHHGPKETMDQAGMELRPTEVVFGNSRGRTPLMQAVRTMGIDLPLKALVWQDEGGKTWLAYNDPKWLAKRHEALVGMDHALGAMAEALAAVAKEATGA
jgi:uncharacterized protein (DUF302 family)